MNIFQQLMQIILLQRRPQDLDYDQAAMVFYVVLTAGMSYITSAQSGAFSQPLIISLVQTGAQFVVLYIFLNLAGNSARFVQTSTALFGITAILTAITWLIAQVPVVSVMVLFLVIWSFYLTILIMRDAFDASILKAVLIAVALGMTAMVVTMFVVPSYIGEAQQMLSVEPQK